MPTPTPEALCRGSRASAQRTACRRRCLNANCAWLMVRSAPTAVVSAALTRACRVPMTARDVTIPSTAMTIRISTMVNPAADATRRIPTGYYWFAVRGSGLGARGLGGSRVRGFAGSQVRGFGDCRLTTTESPSPRRLAPSGPRWAGSRLRCRRSSRCRTSRTIDGLRCRATWAPRSRRTRSA